MQELKLLFRNGKGQRLMENNNENLMQNQETNENPTTASIVEESKSISKGFDTEPNHQTEEKPTKTGRRRILEGRVVSNKPDKTIIVKVERYVQHPIYKKYYRRSKKFMAHDEHNECQVGDVVRIIEWRPLSRRKRWMLKEIVERAK